MHYRKSGTGPLLIYIPGTEGTGQLFFQQEPALKDSFTVACLSLRNNPPFTYDDLSNDIREVFINEGESSAIIVGESFGGTIALQFALRHPEHVRRLLLINTFPYFPQRFRLRLAGLLLPLAFTRPGRSLRNRVFRKVLLNEQVDESSVQRLLQCSWSHSLGTYRERLKLIRQHDVRDQLSRLKMPVVLIAAAKDRLIRSIEEAKLMSSSIPNAELKILPLHGHACLLSKTFDLSNLIKNDVK